LTRPSLTIQRLTAVAVIAVGAALFASALQGITRMDTSLAAAVTRTTGDGALVEPTSYPCLQHGAHDEV
jgi:hypothetical protein